MNCPACENKLTTVKAGDVEVEVCQGGCSGIWFDMNEIKQFDEPFEFDIEKVFLSGSSPKPSTIVHPRYCPKCSGQEIMWKRGYGAIDTVEVDQCPTCSGIWLDYPELTKIRAQFKTEAARIAFSQKLMKEELNEIYPREKVAEWEKVLAASEPATWGWYFRTMFGIGK